MAALRVCGLQGDYSLFPIQPDDFQSLKGLLDRVRAGKITGLNVTIPHKQTVVSFLDELTSTAQAIGAVNTIFLRHDKLIGDNTDAPGFMADLKRFLGTESCFDGARHRLQNQKPRALVLGAGGAARAVVHALANHGWSVSIAARRTEQAQQIALSFRNYELQIVNFSSLQTDVRPLIFDLLVNTTPVGMAPKIDRSPWPGNLPFPAQAVIYDLIYNPSETKFVKDACRQGLSATNGLGMLIEQAALSFEIWTGQKSSRDVMFDAVRQTAR